MRKRTATTTRKNRNASPSETLPNCIDCASESRSKSSPILNVSGTVARSVSPVVHSYESKRLTVLRKSEKLLSEVLGVRAALVLDGLPSAFGVLRVTAPALTPVRS